MGESSDPTNLQELARHLGISVTTVSRVLSGQARRFRISKQTEERIQTAAAQFGVRPDPIGASLRLGRTRTIGLIVPDVANPFFAAFAQGIERRFRKEGYAVLLCDSAEDADVEAELLRVMLSRKAEGLIIAPVGQKLGAVSALVETTVPVVLMDRIFPDLPFPMVATDNIAAAKEAVHHLTGRGHRRIACLRGLEGSFPDGERFKGFQAALKEAGIPLTDCPMAGGDYTAATAAKATRDIFQNAKPKNRPTAIIPFGGQITLGLLESLHALNLSVPEAVSVVAFDEQPWSSLVSPPLTTVAQPVEEMARLAASRLLEVLAGKVHARENRLEVLKAKIVSRESVRTIS